MQNQWEFPSQRTSPWGYTQASGTRMTGPQEEGWWKLTGPRHPSQHTTGTSEPTPRPPQVHSLTVPSRPKNSIPTAEEGWDGFRRTSWFTTTALISNAFLKVSLLSVSAQGLISRTVWVEFIWGRGVNIILLLFPLHHGLGAYKS